MTPAATLRRWFTIARFRIARAAPLTVAGRRPVVLTEADLDAALARRREQRAGRSDASRRGWATRRHQDPLEGALAAPTGPAGEAQASPAFQIPAGDQRPESGRNGRTFPDCRTGNGRGLPSTQRRGHAPGMRPSKPAEETVPVISIPLNQPKGA